MTWKVAFDSAIAVWLLGCKVMMGGALTVATLVAELLEEANASLGTILQSDQQDSATLSAKRMDVAERLAAAETGSRASAAYSAAGAGQRLNVTDAQA